MDVKVLRHNIERGACSSLLCICKKKNESLTVSFIKSPVPHKHLQKEIYFGFNPFVCAWVFLPPCECAVFCNLHAMSWAKGKAAYGFYTWCIMYRGSGICMLLASVTLTVKSCRSKWIAQDQARRYVASRDGKCQTCYDEHSGTETTVWREFFEIISGATPVNIQKADFISLFFCFIGVCLGLPIK